MLGALSERIRYISYKLEHVFVEAYRQRLLAELDELILQRSTLLKTLEDNDENQGTEARVLPKE